MITVTVGALHEAHAECLLRPLRSDFAPVSGASRDLGAAAGESMQDRLELMGLIPVGGAVMTPAGALNADYVIHVVVSAPDEPESPTTVQKALRNGLRRAVDLGIELIALPPLGMGVGALEAEASARVIVEILVNHLDEGAPPLDLTLVAEHPYEAEVLGEIVSELAGPRSGVGNSGGR